MERCGKKWVEKHVAIAHEASEPKPFPGKNPTRCAVTIRWKLANSKKGYQKWSYLGKIRPAIGHKVMKFLSLPGIKGEITAIEFDRNGAIARADEMLPTHRKDRLGVLDWNARIWQYYHPSGYESAELITWAAKPVFRKTIQYGGKKRLIYSAVEQWSSNFIVGHKKWLDLHFGVKKSKA